MALTDEQKDALKKLNEEIARLKKAAADKDEAKVKASLEKIENLKRDFILLLPKVLGLTFGQIYWRLARIDANAVWIGDDVERKVDVYDGKAAPQWSRIEGMIKSMKEAKNTLEHDLAASK